MDAKSPILQEHFQAAFHSKMAPTIDGTKTDYELFLQHYMSETGFLLGDIWDDAT